MTVTPCHPRSQINLLVQTRPSVQRVGPQATVVNKATPILSSSYQKKSVGSKYVCTVIKQALGFFTQVYKQGL